MTQKHTESPWTVEKTGSGEKGAICIQAIDPKDMKMFELASIWGEDDDTEHTEMAQANADLIAAAPDLLEALKEIADGYHRGDFKHSVHQNALNAIAKATGEKA